MAEIKQLQELDDETGIGLIAKRRQGFGKANIIYVKSFMIVEATSDMHEDTIEKFDKTTYDEDTEKEKFINQTIEENVDDVLCRQGNI